MKNLFVITSISASGKTTLVDYVIKTLNLYKLKTCTTRAIRKEECGNEYYFITKNEFENKIKNNDFVEHATVYGKYYGLTKEEVEKNGDKDCIVISDVQGAKTLKSLYPHAVTIFIKPPDMEEIIKRLANRDSGAKDFQNRYLNAEKELNEMRFFDHILNYAKLDTMKKNFKKLIMSMMRS